MILSVIVPVYNEKIQITKNIKKIHSYFSPKFSFEIIVIDDGSKRGLFQNIAKENMDNLKIIRNNQNYGKGYAIRKGIKVSQGELILITDADLSTSIDQFDILYDQYLKGNDIIIGSRSVENSRIIIKQNFIRIIAGKIFNFLVRIITGLNFTDTQCGFKLYNGNKIKKLIPYCFVNKFCIDVEILFLAKKSNLIISEIAIVWNNDNNSSVKLFGDSINMFLDLIRIKWRHR